jgi:hypothetical protein
MRLLALLVFALALWPHHAAAQIGGTPAGTSAINALPVQGVTGGVAMPVSGTFSATLGGFAPATQGTPITATTGGATGTLPAGAVVVVSNAGSTNIAYCALGASATTAAQPIAPGGGWFAFTVGAATQITCATSTSTTTVNLIGGAGLATGTGGGGGGGGGGGATNITQFGGTNISTGTGASGLGIPRVTVANDSTIVANQGTGWVAAGTAGSPAADVISVQGITSMTPVQILATPTALAVGGITPVVTSATATNSALKATAGNFYGAYVESSVVGFLMVADIASGSCPPSDGTVTPREVIPVSASGSGFIGAISYGIPEAYTNGVCAWVSTTGGYTKTTPGSGTFFFHGHVQ